MKRRSFIGMALAALALPITGMSFKKSSINQYKVGDIVEARAPNGDWIIGRIVPENPNWDNGDESAKWFYKGLVRDNKVIIQTHMHNEESHVMFCHRKYIIRKLCSCA